MDQGLAGWHERPPSVCACICPMRPPFGHPLDSKGNLAMLPKTWLSNASIIIGPDSNVPAPVSFSQGLTDHHRQYHASWLPYLQHCIWCSQSVHFGG